MADNADNGVFALDIAMCTESLFRNRPEKEHVAVLSAVAAQSHQRQDFASSILSACFETKFLLVSLSGSTREPSLVFRKQIGTWYS